MIATVRTGTGLTVSVAEPDFPSLVAVIVAVPMAIPVARPDEKFTVATAGLLELHVTRRPVKTLPCASFVVAANCLVCVGKIVAEVGATSTVATGM